MADTADSSIGGGDTPEQQQQQQPGQTRQVPTDPAQIAASAISPSSGEQHQWRGRDVVFVDPLDSTVPYWWPAMIVPTEEIDATMGCTGLGPSEYLVKYFEDFKYSTVNGSELRLFNTSQVPYTDFAAKSPQFLKDKAIKSALSYMRTGLVHAKFQWKLWQTGSETLSLPFVLDTAVSAATAPDADTGAEVGEAASMAVDEESDGSTLVTNLPQDPTSAVSATSGDPDLSANAADIEAEAEAEAGDRQDESDGNVSPNSSSTRSVSQSSRRITRSRSSGNLTPATLSPAKNSPQAASPSPSPSPQPAEPVSATTEATDGDKDDDDNAGDGDDEDDAPQEQQQQQQQQQAILTATPASTATAATTPETASPPRQTQQQQQQPTTRARRGRQPRVAANGTGTTTGTGTGRRGRPPLASKQHQNQNGAKHKRNSSAAVTSSGSGRRGPTVITDSTSMLTEESDNPAATAESSEIKRIVREMMDVQEEYRFFKVLVKRAAKDLWSEMGNEWPPSLGSSTRFGKRRKLA
ncbi:hypothetical protein LPJ53_002109 [Coemansia erecta]|uniref:PWWP domain-containing protein n=1 Tax=Coemansia erecta TaxID=147472 RepID=A0A9W7Y4X3_9FUNG|nr:hypothetical protein LPJ53_002109 [Coemansia erecta]